MSTLFVWLVLGCGAVWRGLAKSVLDVVGGRGRCGVTQPAGPQHPCRLWLRSNPGEERVASCRLHCPGDSNVGFGMGPLIARGRRISSCLTRGGKMWDLDPKS